MSMQLPTSSAVSAGKSVKNMVLVVIEHGGSVNPVGGG